MHPLPVVVLAVLLPSIIWCIPHLGSAAPSATAAELGQSPTIPIATILAAIATTAAAATVQLLRNRVVSSLV
jgi:hypothetical protein